MMTGRTLRWIREPRRVVKPRAITVQVAKSFPCQGSAACIIVTIWPPELSLRTSFNEVDEKPRENRARLLVASTLARFRRSLSSPKSLLQSKSTAKLDSESIHQTRFAPGWSFGEAQRLDEALAPTVLPRAARMAHAQHCAAALQGNLSQSSFSAQFTGVPQE